jgi:methionyl-tRNA synthetase
MSKEFMTQQFYITTPIYYVNDKPHIGHAYTTILADVLSRYHRQWNEDVFFLTGVDEHGQKVLQAAEKRGVSPQAHCDEMHLRFKDLWQKLNIQYDRFIRTTEKEHVEVVQAILQRLYDEKKIYSADYEGWYSVAEERFITDTEKDSGQFRDVIKLKEKNWFFKMSVYQEELIQYIEKNDAYIQPPHRKNEILGFLKQPLGDLCISRPKSRMSWGIEIPFDRDYVTYVWFDALVNYVTGIGYLKDKNNFKRWWPAQIHLIGKDILTTHCVYWSTMLMGLGEALPKTIFAHGWWLTGETKMSKSLGNVIDPLALVEEHGVDAVRYFLMREMVLGQDANFTLDVFMKRYNSDLANDYGNLLNRVSGLLGKYFDSSIPQPGTLTEKEEALKIEADKLLTTVPDLVNQLRINEAVDTTLELIRKTNRYLEHEAPWKVAKTDLPRAGTILNTAAEVLRVSSIFLSPVMPVKTKTVLDILQSADLNPAWGRLKAGTKLQTHEALFPRIELEKK